MFGKGSLFALQYSDCYVIILKRCIRTQWLEMRGQSSGFAVIISPWKRSMVSDFPLKYIKSRELQQEIPLRQRCEAHDDSRALNSLSDISGPSYKTSSSKRCSLWLCFRHSSVFHTKVSFFWALPHHKGNGRTIEMNLGLVPDSLLGCNVCK